MRHRLFALIPLYVLLHAGCYSAAFLLRFDFQLPRGAAQVLWTTLPVVLALKLVASTVTSEWRRSFRYVTLRDVALSLISSSAVAFTLWAGNLVLLGLAPDAVIRLGGTIPRSVILIDAALSILGTGLIRSAWRFHREMVLPAVRSRSASPGEGTLIWRADGEEIGILRTLQATHSPYRVVGFVENNPNRHRQVVAGVPLFSTRKGWKKLAERHGARHLLIPATLPGREVRELVSNCATAGIRTHIIPTVSELVDGRYRLSTRDVTIADLLRREPARLDMTAISRFVAGKRVLVTGAAGSIGSELCRQVLSFQPAELILLDQSENGMFRIQNELLPIAGPVKLRCVIADVCDAETIGTSMRECQPDIVFHAAAYKHVPLMEENPRQAVNNNVIGTRTVADAAHECGVSRFVLISTDKAVRPSSVMGSTKLVAEKYLQARALDSDTSYITVRFGNVLNSDGSVVPTFRSQIEAGGPLTVTHEEMRRFFMTIPEAVQLVLQAGASGSSGDVLILDMGEPIRIMDLARDMILLSGLRYPEDIDIEISGIRPGEKLVEELLYSSEQTSRRIHEKIYCSSRQAVLNLEQLDHEIRQLSRAVDEGAEPARTALAALVAQLVELEDRVIEDSTLRPIGREQPQTAPQPVRRAA